MTDMSRWGVAAALAVALTLTAAGAGSAAPAGRSGETGRIARVVDGDTVVLVGGSRVRLVQIDAPETYFERECWGRQASAAAMRLLPPGTAVRLEPEPATDRVDDYGRLLRYVIRARDGLDVNVQLVRRGDAAPYFYRSRRGRLAGLLERLARRARAQRLGLWGHCGNVRYDPNHAVSTGVLP